MACRAALPSAREGSLLDGRYEIRACLGKGGMGLVYEAYDRVLEERVAIKVLRGQDVDEKTVRRFRSEIKLARRVSHRNVCRIHDYGEDRGILYISMQFLEGPDLRTHLRRKGRLAPDEAYDIALQIADGLQAIHDEGIVHRDLKTANVMLDGQAVARLMDFGIAKATTGGESLTAVGNIVGTPEYMSPEQIRGEAIDARSDVYALGVILFELFTGELPFTSGSAVGVLMKHLDDEPPLDGPAGSTIPAPLREVIGLALAKDCNCRYASAREVAKALRSARVSAPTAPALPAQALRPPVVAASPTHMTTPAPSDPVAATVEAAPALPVAIRGGRHHGVWALLLLAFLMVSVVFWIIWRARSGSATGLSTASRERVIATTTMTASPPPVNPSAPAVTTPVTTTPTIDAPPIGDSATVDDLRRHCDRRVAEGCLRLGILYNTGQGVEKDVARAAELYERACGLGVAGGCNNLGSLHEFGLIGIGPDARRAAQYYRQACDLGDAQACGNLGILMLSDTGLGTAQRDLAIRLMREGCDGRAPRACRKLQELGLSR